MIKIEEQGKKIINLVKNSGKKSLVVLLIIVLIVVTLGSIVNFIFEDDGIWKDKEKGNPSTYTGSTTVSVEDGIKSDKSVIKEEALRSVGYTDEEIEDMTDKEIIEIFKMSEKLNRNITALDDCTEVELLWCISDEYSKYLSKPEELEILLKAELVTQYPRIDGVSSDKVNGIIDFKRITPQQNSQQDKEIILKYIGFAEFEKKYDAYSNNGNEDIFNYFTLDEEGNVVIATWSEENGNFESNNGSSSGGDKIIAGLNEETIKNNYDSRYKVISDYGGVITATYTSYTIEKTRINYKSMIQQHTMPFEYLWALLVMGESYEFVEGLAQLAIDSEIVIGIHDSITTTENVERKEYTENFREKYEKYEREESQTSEGRVEFNDWTERSFSYYEESKEVTKYNSPIIDLIYADTWIVNVTTVYQKNINNSEPYESQNNIDDEAWTDNGSYTERKTETRFRLGEEPTILSDGTQIPTLIPYTVYIRKEYGREKKLTNQMTKTTLNTEYNTYEKVKTITLEKTDTNEETEYNFVKLLRKDSYAFSMLTNMGTVSWLVDVLETNKTTANMVDLTLYLLNKATDSTKYIDGDINFDDIWQEFVLSSSTINLIGRDFIVNTERSEPDLVITDRETLIKIINAKYSGTAKDNLLGQVDTFLEMQNAYHVNAIFAIAVTQIESSCGTNWNAIDSSTHNWMSMTGYYNGNTYRNPNSTNERTWRVYQNFKEATLDFGDVIKNGKYYFKAGKNTVREIAPTYCNTGWGENVITVMTSLFVEAGINVSGGLGTVGYESGESYSSTYTVGGRTYKNYKQPKNSDWCGITSAAIVLSGYEFSDTPSMVYSGSIPGYTWRAYMGNKLGLGELQYSKTDIQAGVIKQLKQGKPVIVHVPAGNPGKYTTEQGHFFVILSLEGDTCYVSDPGVADYDAKGRNGENNIYEVLQYVDQYVVM